MKGEQTTMGEALTGAFTTAVGTIKTDVTTMISTALPAGLAIMGIGLAVRIGINFFRSIANS